MENKTNKKVNFVDKLKQILSQQENFDVISWEPEGKEFIIHNLKQFQIRILPKYFRHSNFSSFIRQLNLYNFHKCKKSPPQILRFLNEKFVRDNLQNINIPRKPQTSRKNRKSSGSQFTADKSIYQFDHLSEESSFEFSSQVSICDLIFSLVNQVREKQFVLESDMEKEVEFLLLTEPYKAINQKFKNSIYECLGLQPKRQKFDLDIQEDYTDIENNRNTSLKFIL